MKHYNYFVKLQFSEWFFAGFLLFFTSLSQAAFTGPGSNKNQGSYTGPGPNNTQGSYTGPGSNMSQGSYTGPDSNTGATTVADILKMPRDDMRVLLIGNLVRKIGHETYMFSDGTGEIRVDIDDEDFPTQPVQADTRVEIMGEVDMDHRSDPGVDVKWIRIAR